MRRTTFYNRNGIIIQKNILDNNDFVELEIKFSRLMELNGQLLLSILTFYLVLKKELNIDYVMSSWTHQKCVLRNDRLNEDTVKHLIDKLLAVKDRLGLVYRFADDYFYVDGNGGYIDTNNDFELVRYEVAKCLGKKFAEKFEEAFSK